MNGGLRAYVKKLSQMDAEHLAGHDCMFARRLEDLRKFQAEVEPAIAEAMTAAFEAGTDDPLTFMGEHMLRSKAKPKSEPAEDSRKRRATLDAAAPLLAHHFRGPDRLGALVLAPSADASTAGADIRLLSARKLVEYIDGGGRMEIRQALEAKGADVFLDAETTRKLLPELETKDSKRCTFPGVAALSYAWERADNPDPEGKQLAQLRPCLLYTSPSPRDRTRSRMPSSA